MRKSKPALKSARGQDLPRHAVRARKLHHPALTTSKQFNHLSSRSPRNKFHHRNSKHKSFHDSSENVRWLSSLTLWGSRQWSQDRITEMVTKTRRSSYWGLSSTIMLKCSSSKLCFNTAFSNQLRTSLLRSLAWSCHYLFSTWWLASAPTAACSLKFKKLSTSYWGTDDDSEIFCVWFFFSVINFKTLKPKLYYSIVTGINNEGNILVEWLNRVADTCNNVFVLILRHYRDMKIFTHNESAISNFELISMRVLFFWHDDSNHILRLASLWHNHRSLFRICPNWYRRGRAHACPEQSADEETQLHLRQSVSRV